MTYASFEEAVYTGEPVELITFEMGLSIWRHTSAETDIVAGGLTYESAIIEHTDIIDSGDAARSQVTFTLPFTHDIAEFLLAYIPTQEIVVTLYGFHRSNTEVIQKWQGVVTSWSSPYPDFELVCSPVDFEINREAMPRRFGPDCQWTQFDGGCGLNPNDFSSTRIVDTVSGTTITLTVALPTTSPQASPDVHYTGGFIELLGAYGYERARIISQSGGLVLDRVLPGMASGVTIKVVPSCRGSLSRCETYFNNRIQFLGAPNADRVNPFSGDGVSSGGSAYSDDASSWANIIIRSM